MSVKTILIVDDDEKLAQALAYRCREMGIKTLISPDGLHAYGLITQQTVDLMILDLNMPGTTGLGMCEELSRDRRFAPIPVIILTGQSDKATIQRCELLGANYVWKGPETWNSLQPVIARLLDLEPTVVRPSRPVVPSRMELGAAPRTPGPKVLVIDDDPDIARVIQIRLKASGVEVIGAHSGMQGYWTALKVQPDVIVLDFNLPEGRGDYLLGRLRDHSLTRNIPVVVLSGESTDGGLNHGLEREMIRYGASAFLRKPLDLSILFTELRQHIRIPDDRPAGLRSPVSLS